VDDYDVDRTVRLRAGLGGILGFGTPEAGSGVIATRREVAAALADLCHIKRPTTPQGIEMLCELIVSVQAHPMSRPEGRGPAHFVGGTWEIGWPIDLADRLNDCVIAAADLGMFDPVRPLPPEQTFTNGPYDKREAGPWPIIETLPNGSESEFSPIGGQWIATRRCAFVQYGGGKLRKALSIHARFLWDLEQLLNAIIDALTDAMDDAGELNHGRGR
jgi:hypothetical protein